MRKAGYLAACALALGAASAEPVRASENESEAWEQNRIGGFVGATGNNRRERGLTLALTYERLITEKFGIGAEIEHVAGDLDFWLATIPFVYHYKEWKFFAGAGVEKLEGGDTEGLLRVGAEYGLEINESWEIAPVVAVDFVDSDTEVIVGLLVSYRY